MKQYDLIWHSFGSIIEIGHEADPNDRDGFLVGLRSLGKDGWKMCKDAGVTMVFCRERLKKTPAYEYIRVRKDEIRKQALALTGC